MKSVVKSVGLFLAAVYLTLTFTREPIQAQTVISTPESAPTTSITQGHTPIAQAAVPPHLRALDEGKVSEAIPLIEKTWENDFEKYFGANFSSQSMTVKDIAATLSQIAKQTGKKPALIYMVPRPQQLEVIAIAPDGKLIHKSISDANKEALVNKVKELTTSIVNPTRRKTSRYLAPAQTLYQWMIGPIEADLQAQSIDTLIFCVGAGLRTLPMAALHDGQQFLVEKYSFSRIPAFSLTDTVYGDLRNSRVLAMGASEFQDQVPLPAVPVELSAIMKNLWQGTSFLNEDFTLTNLQSQQASQPYKIIHLATHAAFQPGSPNNSYVQFWDSKLTLDKMRQLRWDNPPVELLVLSACKTAIGDEQAELGFAGIAVQAQVKSVLASLWEVSDEGTLALMTEFYRHLKTAPIKAEALRQAQIAMLKGQVRLEDGRLQSSMMNIPLPSGIATIENDNLSSPYYWAAFTVVGSPW